MKKKLIASALLFITFIGATAFIISSNGMIGQTGSPGEGTCGGCHNLGTGVTTISISAVPAFTANQFQPGQTYTINVTVINANYNSFGFDCEILDPSLNNAGTMSNPGAGIQLLLFGSKLNATHTTPMSGVGQANFDFTWVAPLSGTATIYVAGNAVNLNGNTTGDKPGNSSLILTAPSPPPTPPVASFTLPGTQCTSVALTMSNTSTGTPTPTYTWSVNPSAVISNSTATNPTITFTNSANYSVTLVAVNGGGTSTVTHTLTANVCTVAAVAAFNMTSTICTSVVTTMSNTSIGTPSPTFTWSSNPLAVISNSTTTNPGITFNTAGIYTVTLLASNGSTSSATQTINVVACPTQLNERDPLTENELKVFPNPASTELHVHYHLRQNGKVSIQLYDLLGKQTGSDLLEYQLAGEHQYDLDLKHVPKGIYTVRILLNETLLATRSVRVY